MANAKISALTSATTPLVGTETLPVVQSSATTKVTVANLTAGRAVGALSYTSTSNVSVNTSYTSSVAEFIYCDNTSGGGAVLNVRKGRDIGTGGVDGVGLDCLNAAGSAVVPGIIRGSPFYINDGTGTTTFSGGKVGIGVTPTYQLQVNTDSAGKPGVGGLWTVVSDERIKTNIVPADLARCYEIVKQVGLKHFGFAPGAYLDNQINDKHNLGWIAQDVQKVFSKAVSVKPFTFQTDIPDGEEEYEEQEFKIETDDEVQTIIQIIDNKAVQITKSIPIEQKIFLFDTLPVVDEAGAAVTEEYIISPAANGEPAVIGTRQMTYQVPRMVKKKRQKFCRNVIEDCLDLNSGQMIAAMYGAIQMLMMKVEALEPK